MQAFYKAYISPEEYLELEREAETKSEYYRGEVYAMAGANERHSTIQVNTLASLTVQLRNRSCKAHGSDLRVKVSHTGLYTYPDASVVCGPARFDDKQRMQSSLSTPSGVSCLYPRFTTRSISLPKTGNPTSGGSKNPRWNTPDGHRTSSYNLGALYRRRERLSIAFCRTQ